MINPLPSATVKYVTITTDIYTIIPPAPQLIYDLINEKPRTPGIGLRIY
jgi:hypothetical protein